MKRTRKLLAMFIMFIMVMGEMGSAVFAAGIDAEPDSLTLKEEAVELLSEPAEALADAEDVPDVETASATDGKADELADIDDTETIAGKDGAGLQVFVNGVDFSSDAYRGKYLGTDGTWYNSMPSGGYITYDNLYLTMKDYELKGNFNPATGGTYADDKVPATNIEVKGTAGDVTIQVIGNCSIRPYGNTGYTNSAICADGNLYIESTYNGYNKRVPGDLFIANSGFKSGAEWDGGIYCGGNLTLSSPGENSGDYFEGLTVICETPGEGSNDGPAEIYSQGNMTLEDAMISIEVMKAKKTYSNGIWTDASLSISKGEVQILNNFKATDSNAEYYGIFAGSDISLDEAVVDVECRPTDPNLKECCGIYTAGKLTVSGGELSSVASDNKRALHAEGTIELNGAIVTYPDNGAISQDGKTIVDGGGNAAYRAVIKKGQLYDLWIGSTRVTSFNCGDLSAAVEGTGATAAYDPASNTLTLNNVTGVKGNNPTNYSKIYSAFAFKLRGNNNKISSDSTSAPTINVEASTGMLDIEGGFTITGKNHAIYADECGIIVDGATTVLSATSDDYAQSGIFTRGFFVLNGGKVNVSGKHGLSATANVFLNGGELNATGSEAAVYVNSAELNISDTLDITSPAEGTVGKKGNIATILEGSDFAKVVKVTAKPSFTVTFSLNGKPGTPPASETVLKGYTVDEPYTVPTTPGFVFDGWYKEPECTNLYDFSTPVTADITLYAKWREKEKFTATFDMNGKTATDVPADQIVEEGGTITKPAKDPKADGFKFIGWFRDKECKYAFDFTAQIVANTTVYAKWVPEGTEMFTVTFNLNGKSGTAPASQTVEKGGNASRPSNPYAGGYTFMAWYTEAECTNKYDFNTPVVANLTLYAGWVDGFATTGIWNLYENVMPHEYNIVGMNVNGSVENSNAKSKKFYEASISSDGSTTSITVILKGDRKKAATPANSVLEFDLGPDGVVEYSLPVYYAKPVFKLSSSATTIKDGVNTTIHTNLLYKNSVGQFEPYYDMSGVNLSGIDGITKLTDGTIEFHTSKALKGNIEVTSDGWNNADPVKLPYTVKASKKDVLNVDLGGLKTVIVNSNAKSQKQTFDVTLNGAAVTPATVKITDKKDTKLATITAAGKLEIGYPATELKAGTYTVTLEAGDAKTNVKIKVTNADLSKALGGKVQTKLDVVTGSSMVVIPKFKELSGKITDVSVIEPVDTSFYASVNTAGNIEIGYWGDKYNVKNLKIGDMRLAVTIDGIAAPVELALKGVSAQKPNPKVTASPVIIPGNALAGGSKVIGATNILSTYKMPSGESMTLYPNYDGVEILSTNNVTANVNPYENTEINVTKLDGKSGSIKVKVTYHGGLEKTITIKVSKKK